MEQKYDWMMLIEVLLVEQIINKRHVHIVPSDWLMYLAKMMRKFGPLADAQPPGQIPHKRKYKTDSNQCGTVLTDYTRHFY